jgi:hypothetical protein
MHMTIRRLATNLDVKLHGLQQLLVGSDQQRQIDGVQHLKEFVQSAATVLSSASTIQSVNGDGEEDTETNNDFRSDFGGWFKTEVNVATLDWVYSDNSSTSITDRTEIRSTTQRLVEASSLGLNRENSSLTVIPAANQLSAENLSDLNLSASRGYKSTQSLAIPKDNTKETSQSLNNTESLNEVTLPLQQTQPAVMGTLDQLYPSISETKGKRRSLGRLFSRKGLARKESAQEPKAKKPSLHHVLFSKSQVTKIQKKIVFVGDGACGKTCFLMSVTLMIRNRS